MPRRIEDGAVTLDPGALPHTQYLFELYAGPEVRRAHGFKLPIPAVDWRRILGGLWPGWQHVWVIRFGPLLAGHVGLQNHSEHDRRAELVITVDPALQGRGIGRQALTKAIDRCDARLGIGLLILRVRAGNKAGLDLFESAGFGETGRIPGYYREADGPEDQVILCRTRRTP